MANQVSNFIAQVIQTNETEQFRKDMTKYTENGQAIAVAAIVVSVAFTALGIAIGGIPGTLLALFSGFAGIISLDSLSALNNMNKMLQEARYWTFLSLPAQSNEQKQNAFIGKVKESIQDTIILKYALPPILTQLSR